MSIGKEINMKHSKIILLFLSTLFISSLCYSNASMQEFKGKVPSNENYDIDGLLRKKLTHQNHSFFSSKDKTGFLYSTDKTDKSVLKFWQSLWQDDIYQSIVLRLKIAKYIDENYDKNDFTWLTEKVNEEFGNKVHVIITLKGQAGDLYEILKEKNPSYNELCDSIMNEFTVIIYSQRKAEVKESISNTVGEPSAADQQVVNEQNVQTESIAKPEPQEVAVSEESMEIKEGEEKKFDFEKYAKRLDELFKTAQEIDKLDKEIKLLKIDLSNESSSEYGNLFSIERMQVELDQKDTQIEQVRNKFKRQSNVINRMKPENKHLLFSKLTFDYINRKEKKNKELIEKIKLLSNLSSTPVNQNRTDKLNEEIEELKDQNRKNKELYRKDISISIKKGVGQKDNEINLERIAENINKELKEVGLSDYDISLMGIKEYILNYNVNGVTFKDFDSDALSRAVNSWLKGVSLPTLKNRLNSTTKENEEKISSLIDIVKAIEKRDKFYSKYDIK